MAQDNRYNDPQKITPECGLCYFWDTRNCSKEEYHTETQGYCKKNPPTLINCEEPSILYFTCFPKTGYSQWCGDFEEDFSV